MKFLIPAAFAACLLVPQSSLADQVDPDVLVRAPTQTQAWMDELSSQLTHGLRYPASPTGQYASGIVAIGFIPGNGNSPAELAVLRSSGSKALDRAALRAVGRLEGLSPLPQGVLEVSVIRANIIFAESKGQLDRYATQLRHDEAARIAASGPEQTQIALTVSNRTPG
ncbi:MAG TPA: TonB family protein [Novosphingobium sp.]|nr:TonB family protein [Novosphingobium sp.]